MSVLRGCDAARVCVSGVVAIWQRRGKTHLRGVPPLVATRQNPSCVVVKLLVAPRNEGLKSQQWLAWPLHQPEEPHAQKVDLLRGRGDVGVPRPRDGLADALYGLKLELELS